MSVKITLEYTNVEEAIAALGKLAGIAPASATQPAVVEKAPRKGRSDAGQPRGPNARTVGEQPAVQPAAPTTQASAPASSPAPVAAAPTPVVAAAQPAPAPQPAAPAQTVPQAPAQSAAPVAAAPIDDATIQAAVEKLFNAKGYDDTAMVLSRFGVQRGKDLLPAARAEFLAKVDRVIAGEAI